MWLVSLVHMVVVHPRAAHRRDDTAPLLEPGSYLDLTSLFALLEGMGACAFHLILFIL